MINIKLKRLLLLLINIDYNYNKEKLIISKNIKAYFNYICKKLY